MPQVTLTIAGKTYRVACGEGEEARLGALAEDLDGRIGALRGSFGEIGDLRLHVMAGLTLADELGEARAAAEAARAGAEAAEREAREARGQAEAAQARLDEIEGRVREGVSRAADRRPCLARGLGPVAEVEGRSTLADRAGRRYIGGAGLRGASGDISPGPYRSPRELSLARSVDRATRRPPTL